MAKNNRKSKSNVSLRFEPLETRNMMTAGLLAAFSQIALVPLDQTADVAVASPVAKVPNFIDPGTTIRNPIPWDPGTTVRVKDWFDFNIVDPGLHSLAQTDFNRDGKLTRNDMIDIFREVESKGNVTATEFSDLQKIVNNPDLFVNLGYVQQLSQDVVNGNPANGHYQGQVLGSLAVGSSNLKLEQLVGKWFLGKDEPSLAHASGTEGSNEHWLENDRYQYAFGTLFGPGGPVYTDVDQGPLGDCYLLAPLAETALRDPNTIKDMFIDNHDGTYTVRFFNNGTPEYLTVDRWLPVEKSGFFGEHFTFASNGQHFNNVFSTNVLWVALAEKAYAQLDEQLWSRADKQDNVAYANANVGGLNSYAAIGATGGDSFVVGQQITGTSGEFRDVQKGVQDAINTLIARWSAGYEVSIATNKTLPMLLFQQYDLFGLVPNHEYAVTGYDPKNQTITLFNPWGINNGHAPAEVTLGLSLFMSEVRWVDVAGTGSSWHSTTGLSYAAVVSPSNSVVSTSDAQIHGNIASSDAGQPLPSNENVLNRSAMVHHNEPSLETLTNKLADRTGAALTHLSTGAVDRAFGNFGGDFWN